MTWLHPRPWINVEISPLVEVRQSVCSCLAMILYASLGLAGSMTIVSLGKTSATVSGLGSTSRELMSTGTIDGLGEVLLACACTPFCSSSTISQELTPQTERTTITPMTLRMA